ncbi:MAG TPA: hypothetical protein VJH05_00265 [Candidatus Paceibacterota bacterium]
MDKLGFGLVEIVVASAIISVSIFSLSAVSVIGNRLQSQSLEKIRANFLAEEGLEALRFLRDKSWNANLSSLSVGTNYYISFASSTSQWNIGSTVAPNVDSFFERKITVENVFRDSNDNIDLSGGTQDPDTKKVSISVSWRDRNATTTINLSTYLSDIFDN